MSTPFDTTVPAAARPAHPNRVEFLRKIMLEKAELKGLATDEASAKLEAWLPTLTADTIGGHIDATLDQLKQLRTEARKQNGAAAQPAPAGQRWESVVEGRYAIPTQEGATNELAFYKVDRPTEGRWAGYTFVKRLVGPDEQRLSQKQGAAIVKAIAEFGADKASKLYGQEIGHCGVCGRRLTNDESREYGIGPDCRAKLGW